MKSLSQHISEKLIINKNYKNADDIKKMFDNIEFTHPFRYTLLTNEDIFSIMVDYIRDNNIKSFSDFDSYKEIAEEGNNVCLVIFNKRIKNINIFQKTSPRTYKDFTIFKRHAEDNYQFEKYAWGLLSLPVLKNNNTWNNVDDAEYYEISEETFNDISELYDELIKK